MKWRVNHVLLMGACAWLILLFSSCSTQKQFQQSRVHLDSMQQLKSSWLTYTLQLADTLRVLELSQSDTVTQRIIIRGTSATAAKRDTQGVTICRRSTDSLQQTQVVNHPVATSAKTSFFNIVLGIVFVLLLTLFIRLLGIKF